MPPEVYDRVAPIAEEWDELAETVEAPPFHRPGWIDTWWAAFGTGTLEVLALRRNGGLAAVAPLVRGRGVGSATNWHTPSFDAVAADEEARQALASELVARAGARLRFGFLPPESAAVYAAAARDAGFRTIQRTLQSAPYLETAHGWEAYAQSLGRKRLAEIERRERRLQEEGQVDFELARPEGGRLDELLEEGFRLEASGWKGREGTAIVSSEVTRAFYTSVCRWAAGRGVLRLAFLRLDGRPIGFELVLEDGRRLYNLKGGYDESHARYAPGALVKYHLIRHAFERGLQSVEFLGTADSFKLQWTDTMRERVLLQAFRGPVGLAEYGAHRYGRPLARRLRALAR